jgi:hypothetical protein
VQIPAFLEIYKRVFETEMFYPFLVYFIAISLGTMYEFLVIISVVLIANSFLLTVAHLQEKRALKLAGKALNIGLTIVGFINIFASDFYFADFAINS